LNVWDLAALWSARRWLRRLRARLVAGRRAADDSPAISAALDQHVQAVRTQINADISAREGMVPTPFVVLLAIYTEGLYREAIQAGWQIPEVWSPDDGVSMRLLACCEVASRRNGPVRR
jgi:Family of unknown function (DUF6401)